jgi:hypothetical protein
VLGVLGILVMAMPPRFGLRRSSARNLGAISAREGQSRLHLKLYNLVPTFLR